LRPARDWFLRIVDSQFFVLCPLRDSSSFAFAQDKLCG
jgi:hypothetical protein